MATNPSRRASSSVRSHAQLLIAAGLSCGLAGCAADEQDRREPDASMLDGGELVKGRLDASLDAALPAPPDGGACYSPLWLPEPGLPGVLVSRLAGCPCPGTSNPSGYCLHGYAVRCYSDGWGFGADGNCAPPRAPDALGSCRQRGGSLLEGDAGCPGGFDTRGRYQGDAGTGELAPCCLPIEVSHQNCSSAGLTVAPAEPLVDKLLARCPNGDSPRAFVLDDRTSGLCCAR
jgi:hypothetical protein